MDFRILGPLEARQGDRVLPLGGGKQRALLAILLLNANEAVSSDRLVDGLWGERPPATASKALQVYVSQLRKLLEPERAPGGIGRLLVTSGSGYLLRVEADQLDAHRFSRLLAQGRVALTDGRPAEAARALTECLSLWRGEPLADVASEPFAQMEIARLEELRVTALEERIEAELQLGRHAEVIGELEALVRAHPLREQLRGRLMLALYRAGRQAEALATYQAARRVLTDELGVEPSAGLKDLQRAILTQDPSLEVREPTDEEAATPNQAHRTSTAPVFVGREDPLAELLAGLEQSLAGYGSVFLISGEPGIGKSRLAEELARHALERGAQVLVGRCWEGGGAPAFWPWTQALRAYVQARPPEALRLELGGNVRDVAQILPELGDLVPELAALPPTDSEAARFRLFESTTSLLRTSARAQPLVLVLDDLHAADAPSLLLLQFLCGALGQDRVLVVGAYRDVDPAPAEPLSSMLVELSRTPRVRRLPLRGLSEKDVAMFVELSAPAEAPRHVAELIHRETEGNPLFVGEIVRLLLSQGSLEHVTADSSWQLGIPEGIRAVIGRRLRYLSADCKLALAYAAVLGREFRLDVLERFGEFGMEDLLGLLDEASQERVVGEVPAAPGRMRFAHALIRDTLYEGLSPGRRLQLHRHAGEALEALYEGDIEPHLAELAHHFLAAVPAGVANKAIEYAWRAGNRAAAMLAFEEAIRFYAMTLPLLRTDAKRCELLLALAEAQGRSGETSRSKNTYREAADLAGAIGASNPLARAALGYGGRFVWEAGRDDRHLVPLLERALTALGEGDNALRVRLLARLAGGPLRDSSFPQERRVALSREALETARRIRDPATLAYALAGYVLANDSPDKSHERLLLAGELVELAVAIGDKERAVEGHEVCLLSSLELGDVHAARVELEAMATLAGDLRQPAQEWFAAAYRALLALLEGSFSEAEELIPRAFALGSGVQEWSATVSYRLQLYLLRREQGRLGEVDALLRDSVRQYPTYPIWRCAFAQMTAELGLEPESREMFNSLTADDVSALPFDEEWLVGMSLLAETADLLNDAPGAAILYEQLLPYAERVGVIYIEISSGSIHRYLGILASTGSRCREAEGHFEAALKLNARIGARPWLAHTQADYARMLLKRDDPGDAKRARSLLDQAIPTYRELGMNSHLVKISMLQN
jgi:DNA-binding SARP family transcriptional activator